MDEYTHIREALITWLQAPTYWDERHYLEQTPALWGESAFDVLNTLLAESHQDDDWRDLLVEHRLLLEDIRQRGASPEAIVDAYVNFYGGYSIDLLPWLAEANEQGRLLSEASLTEATIRARLHLWQSVLTQAQADPQVPGMILAETYCRLADTIDDLPLSTPDEQVESIRWLQQAHAIYTLERFPLQWARVQNDLALRLMDQIAGEDEAKTAFLQALQIYNAERFPNEWANVHTNLGLLALRPGPGGTDPEAALSHFLQAAQVFRLEHHHSAWIRNRMALAQAYQARFAGNIQEHHTEALRLIDQALAAIDSHEDEEVSLETLVLAGKLFLRNLSEDRASLGEHAEHAFNQVLAVTNETTFSHHWAAAHHNLAILLLERNGEQRREDIEEAISHLHQSLSVRTADTAPVDWVMSMTALTDAYRQRIAGDRSENLEHGLACCLAVLALPTFTQLPLDGGTTWTNVGALYTERILGEQGENLERAIDAYRHALRAYSREQTPNEWARTMMNLGIALTERVEGDLVHTIHEAQQVFEQALSVYTQQAWPMEWSEVQTNLGLANMEQIDGARSDNLQRARMAFHAAQTVATATTFPERWAALENNLGMVERYAHDFAQAVMHFRQALTIYTSERFPSRHYDVTINLAEAYALSAQWANAHEAYTEAQQIEHLLLALANGARERDALLRSGREMMLRDAAILAELGRVAEAVAVAERGRARAIADARISDLADPQRIQDAGRRQRFLAAQRDYQDALAVVQIPGKKRLPGASFDDERQRLDHFVRSQEQCHQAYQDLQASLAEIQAAGDPSNFFQTLAEDHIFQQALANQGAGYALIYILVAPWGSWILAVQLRETKLFYQNQPLPHVTSWMIDTLLEHAIGQRLVGGYAYALEGKGLEMLRRYGNGATLAEYLAELATFMKQHREESTLLTAISTMMRSPDIRRIASLSLDALRPSEAALLTGTFRHAFLAAELEYCLPLLGREIMLPLLDRLAAWGITHYTLIPSGALNAFPLLATPYVTTSVAASAHGEEIVGSLAPNALALIPAARQSSQRQGIFALGDPYPTGHPLPWSEAEALAIGQLGGTAESVVTQEDATRAWLVHALDHGEVVAVACHGRFDPLDFLNSALLLAHTERLTLADALNHVVDLRGLRLLLLSACQSATFDLRGARDEVRSLATGMLQAGVASVIATFWTVDDQATFIIMVRFMQLWVARSRDESPAHVLAQATHWIRQATVTTLREWAEHLRMMPPIVSTMGADLFEARTVVSERGGSQRYTIEDAATFVQESSVLLAEGETPFASPIYWAAFAVYGW